MLMTIPAQQGATTRSMNLPVPFRSLATAPVDWHEWGPDAERARRADAMALSLRAARDQITVPLARAAAALVVAKGWNDFGYARLGDYARERLGRSSRWVNDLAALGRGLPLYQGLGQAMMGEDGHRPLGRVAALLVMRIASAASLSCWIRTARKVSVRELRDLIRKTRETGTRWPPGAGPPFAEITQGNDHAAAGAVMGCPRDPQHDHHDRKEDTQQLDPEFVPDDDSHDDPDDDRCRDLVKLPVTRPVQAAFDEAVDFHSALTGSQAPVSSVVENMIAEAACGPDPPPEMLAASGIVVQPIVRGGLRADSEHALARATNNWEFLQEKGDVSWQRALGRTLTRLRSIVREAGKGSPARLDGQIRGLLEIEDELERQLGRLLYRMQEGRAWRSLRFNGVGHYAEQRLGMSRTSAKERVRVERALGRYPLLREAYEEDIISLQAVLRVVQILKGKDVVEADEHAWVDRARRATIKRLDDEAREFRRAWCLETGMIERWGPTGIDGGRRRRRPLDDHSWHSSLSRGPGLARERLGRFARAALDGGEANVFLRLRLEPDLAEAFLATVEDRRARVAALAEAIASGEQPDSRGSLGRVAELLGRTFSRRRIRVPAWAGLLVLIEEFFDTWDNPEAHPHRARTHIYARDGWRCMAPGCTSRRNLEDHHVVYRSRGGGDRLSNRLCLCRFHHQMGEHGRLASCRGVAPTGIAWRLGKPEVSVRYRNELRRS